MSRVRDWRYPSILDGTFWIPDVKTLISQLDTRKFLFKYQFLNITYKLYQGESQIYTVHNFIDKF